MTTCPCCRSTKTERAKNDAGFFRSPSTKPVRIYQWCCLNCGFVGHYAGDPKQQDAADLLGAKELTPIGGDED